MKKNLRIVSVAAAALLAVAPVAASAVSTVNADPVQSATNIGPVKPLPDNAKVNITPNVTLTTSVPNTDIKAALNASFTATVDGTTATSTFEPNVSSVKMWYYNEKGDRTPVEHVSDVTAALAGTLFKVQLHGVSLNFGTKNANKDITLVLPNENGNHFGNKAEDLTYKTKTDKDGVATISEDIILGVYAKDFANPAVVNWLNSTTNAVVNSGNVELYAGSDAGKMNVDQVVNEVLKKYYATNFGTLENKESSHIKYTNNLVEALKAMNVPVTDGWFVAPKSFTFNMTATANNNDASKTLPVTVNVPNGKDVTPATVPSQSKTIMHNAYFYDKDAKRVGTDKVTRYNTVTVAMNTTKLANGISYYEVIENGKATGKFINADNIDGTKRTLKHNAYVYKSSKKRANKVVLKKGTEVTTYGGSYTFKNGKQYYKIGNNTDKTYVKVANF
ncbi:SLAP domain-containing protein [Lactobacillus sp. N54.MGS-719]|uniref:SLAP domain-containing protein n=1 Tax=Lactobacillus sp. N54.MGS-719 TaxID=1637512 RepID=UPI000623686F|nr:SLAP domain-containing protein [Lactobacillus sp. N54.MGS-719]